MNYINLYDIQCQVFKLPWKPTGDAQFNYRAKLINTFAPSFLSRGEGKKAADCLRKAFREYNLKFATILNDPDLASFRALPEFAELQEEARLGGEDIGYSFRRDLKLTSEVQAPFRGIRRFFSLAFSAAAGISLFFTVPRLLRAIKEVMMLLNYGKLLEMRQLILELSIGITALVALFLWDNKKEEEQLTQISRDETLSRLPLRLATNRIVELVQLRDTVRPVTLAGNKETVSLAMQKVERFRSELLRRSVLLIPVIWGEGNTAPVEKKGFGSPAKAAASLPSIGYPLETPPLMGALVLGWRVLINNAKTRFRAEVVSPAEWERWIKDQQRSEGVNLGEDVCMILRLDGRVRRSGKFDVVKFALDPTFLDGNRGSFELVNE
ncbi:Protein LOW PSII ACCUMULATION 1-like [Dillenia turbinata]|uniref:Protein LOW PSII ACCUMULATION 1-like n=1 Tax=Dillenia turbinata TaxID=194707 RepID=A0AAN8VVZ7_9MAGN